MTIQKRLRKSNIGVLLRREYWRFRGKEEYKRFDDYTFLKNHYRKLGRELNLKKPSRFTEKLQWLKLFYRNDLMPVCSDKYEMRSYISSLGMGYLLNELIAVYNSVDEIDIDKLPNQCVIKASHGSGWNFIIKNKEKTNWFWKKKIMKSWMKQNLSWFGREWNYASQKPRIIVEKYLEDDSGELRDYKVFCMNGEPRVIQVDENRSSQHKRTYFDINGQTLDVQDSQKHIGNVNISFGKEQEEMIRIAQVLSSPFPHVRVDFYLHMGKIYLGEMTFFDGSGFYSFDPDGFDYVMGEWLQLPEPNYNIELHRRIMAGEQ